MVGTLVPIWHNLCVMTFYLCNERRCLFVILDDVFFCIMAQKMLPPEGRSMNVYAVQKNQSPSGWSFRAFLSRMSFGMALMFTI